MPPITNDEYTDLVNRLKSEFRTKDDCEVKHEVTTSELHSLDSKFTAVTTKLNFLLAILGCIGAAVVGIFLKMIIGG